jgi:hypothetical protein
MLLLIFGKMDETMKDYSRRKINGYVVIPKDLGA